MDTGFLKLIDQFLSLGNHVDSRKVKSSIKTDSQVWYIYEYAAVLMCVIEFYQPSGCNSGGTRKQRGPVLVSSNAHCGIISTERDGTFSQCQRICYNATLRIFES